MSLNNLRNRLKKLETEKGVGTNNELSADDTDTYDVTVDRTTWVSKIQRNGNKPGDWLEMMKCLENTQFTSDTTRYLFISNTYADALKSIPDAEKKTLPYAKLLIQCANFRGQQSIDDAREMFQDARYDAKKFAIVHIAAAQFELNQGNKDKAKKILDKAKSQHAEPASLVTAAFKNIIYGQTQLLNECDEQSLCITTDNNKENIDNDSNSHTLPPKLSGFKPPLHPNLSYRKRHTTSTELKPTLSHVQSDDDGIISFLTNRTEHRSSENTSISDEADTVPMNASSCKSNNSNSGEFSIPHHTLRSYHSTPDCKKSGILSMPSGSSVKGVFARKKMNLGRPMRVPRASPLTEHGELRPIVSANQQVPESAAALQQMCAPSVSTSNYIQSDELIYSRLMDSRRHSESDDDSIRLKPLPEFSPERQQPHNHSVFDVRSGRGSMDSDSGIVSHPGTGNMSSHLPSISDSKHISYSMSPPHLSGAAVVTTSISKSTDIGAAPRLLSLDPKQSQTKSFLDASQLSTKTLVNNSLVDGASKTLTDHNSNKENLCNINEQANDVAQYHNRNVPEQLVGSNSDSGMSSGNSNSQDNHPSAHQSGKNASGVMDVDGNIQCHIKDQGQFCDQDQVHNGQKHLPGFTQSQQASALQDHHVMQTPHQKQKVVAMMCTPMQQQYPVGMMCAQPMATPVHGAGLYPGYVPGTVAQQQIGACAPSQFPQMMTPLQNQQKMLWIKGKCYTVIRIIGKGGYSKVYEVFDSEYNMRAVKCINMDSADESTIESYKNEIELLQRLQYSRLIIKMFDYEYNEADNMLYVVMEKGERDLATFFRSRIKRGDMSLKLLFFYWEEMLKAVLVLHKEGIVHSDLKPPNFLIVAGDLKLIDFGIAKAIQSDMTSVTREQQVGTLNYMSPEAFMDTCGGTQLDEQGRVKPRIKIGVKSDVWSLGCILYYLVYRKTPFQHITNAWLKLQAIANTDLPIEFPEPEHFGPTEHTQLINVMKRCLTRDPKNRPSIEELLDTPLWTQHSSTISS